MKKALIYIPIVLSLIILGAHFMRYGNAIGVAGALALIALLFVHRAWVARLMQTILVLGAAEWAWTTFELVQERAAYDQPFVRMTVILGTVALATFCSALLFQLPAMKRTYQLH